MTVSEQRWSTNDEEAALEAPETFRQAIMRDPYAGVFKFDQDTFRGDVPIDPEQCLRGGTPVPKSGYWVDLDGRFINYYYEGDLFPKYSAVSGVGGRFFFITARRGAPKSDLLYILLRSGYPGDIKELAAR